jgi:hypothetical protein
MDLYTPGVALAAARIAELRRQADQQRLASRLPGRTRGRHRQAGLLDHYDRVQREDTRLRQARAWARPARRYAIWALYSSAGSILLAAVALLTR